MKAIVILAGLLVALGSVFASTESTKTAGPNPAAPTKAAGKKPAAKVEEEPKIDGVTIPRSQGGFLGLSVDNGTFKLSFYDEKKKPMTVDVTRATARWNASHKIGDERTVLNPGPDGKSLIGGKPVRPPFVFKVFLTLLKGEGDEAAAVENYTVAMP